MRKRDIVELSFGLLAVIGFILQVFHVVGGTIIVVVSLLTLAVYYFIGGYFILNKYKFSKSAKKENKIPSFKAAYTVCLGLFFSMTIQYILFKLMGWEGAEAMDKGLLLLIFAALFLLIYATLKKQDLRSYKLILIRFIIIIPIGMMMYNIPAIKFIELYHKGDQEYIDAYKKMKENPEDREALENWERIVQEREKQ